MTLARTIGLALLAALACSAVSAEGRTSAQRSPDQIPTVHVVGERPVVHDALARIGDYRVPASATRIAPPDPVTAWQLVTMR